MVVSVLLRLCEKFSRRGLIAKDVVDVSLDASFNATLDVDAKITRPPTGSANIVPIAYGTVNATVNPPAILNGTTNFTVTRFGTGSYGVFIVGESFTNASHTAQVSICGDGTPAIIKCYQGGGAAPFPLIVSMVNSAATDLVDRIFCFTVYKPN